MPFIYQGSDNNIQRKVRRAWQYLKDKHPTVFKLVPNALISSLLKAIFIALDEDYANYHTIANPPLPLPQGAIAINDTDPSLLDQVPYDLEV